MVSVTWLRMQLKYHLVAVISLVTALGGLSLDTWRDHQNELHQTQRQASFEMLKHLAELQSIVDHAHYAGDTARGDPIEGWKHVLLLRDLSAVLPVSNQQHSQRLLLIWQQQWESLMQNAGSEAVLSQAIEQSRRGLLQTIATLN